MEMSELWKKKDIESRSITPENPEGSKGGGAKAKSSPELPCSELGDGWKVRPSVQINPGETYTMAEIDGPGAIKHIWVTCCVDGSKTLPWFHGRHLWREMILRIYWEGEQTPAVECPLGDFFACGWGEFAQVSSLPVCVNPGSSFNCYWEMPFKRKCRITLENRWSETALLYYQIDYEKKDLPEEILYFHTYFHRTNPTKIAQTHEILPHIKGSGCYVGTYIAWGVNNNGWWGEGEVKFYLDGDTEHPTICGTGTEDYFGGSFNFENLKTKQYQEYTTPFVGLPQVLKPDGVYRSQQRFGMYRWHITDPVYFHSELRVDVQALGWTPSGKFRWLQDDVASTAFWYQAQPSSELPAIQSREELEII